MALLEEVCHWGVGFGVQKDCARPRLSLLPFLTPPHLMLVDQIDVNVQLLFHYHAQLASTLSNMMSWANTLRL